MGTRTFGAIPVTQALLVGAVINIIPDYLSLIETRWLLERFGRHTSFAAHVGLLIADLIFSAAIVTAGIYSYVWFAGERIPSPVELVALFSVYSVFFYSTFMTSAWAWVYCISVWFVRLFSKVGLRKILDVKKDPVKQIALVGAAVMVLGGTTAGPVLWPKEGGFSNTFDDFVCSFDRRACFHAGRIAADIDRATHFMEAACGEENENVDCAERLKASFSEDEEREIHASLDRACNGGNAGACRALGYTVDYGIGGAPDPARAAELYRQACDAGDSRGCHNLGLMFAEGRGVQRADPEQASALYTQACDGGYSGGCVNLGFMYQNGNGVARDPVRAVALYQQACSDKETIGCVNLGWMYQNGEGVQPDPIRAIAHYQQACDAGYMNGCNNLGSMYQNGHGVEVDLHLAATLYQQACGGRLMLGCNNLGWMYQNGFGVETDLGEALVLYLQACDNGNTASCVNLGWLFENGEGVGVDTDRAFKFYQQACEGDQLQGCANLGTMYEHGKGVAPDPARAKALYRQACDGGWTEACRWIVDPATATAAPDQSP
jgi:TPR repeat protein